MVAAVLPRCRRVLLAGPTETGKTWCATTEGLLPGQDTVVVTMTDELPAAELRGYFLPHGRRVVWTDGLAVRAWRMGARLVLNEIDHAGADALGFLLAILDDPEVAMLTLPSGETIRPAPGFTVVATMNSRPSSALPVPLRGRFPVALWVDQVHPGALASLPSDLRAVAARTSLIEDPERRVPIRSWKEYARLRDEVPLEYAARACFGERAPEVLGALAIARADPRRASRRKGTR